MRDEYFQLLPEIRVGLIKHLGHFDRSIPPGAGNNSSPKGVFTLTPPPTKQQILRAAGYWSDDEREIYYNRSARKVFSVEFIDRHNEAEIEQSASKDIDACRWRFYFNSEPSETVKSEIVHAVTSGRGRRYWGEFEV